MREKETFYDEDRWDDENHLPLYRLLGPPDDDTVPRSVIADRRRAWARENFELIPFVEELRASGVRLEKNGDLITIRIPSKGDVSIEQNLSVFCNCAHIVGLSIKIIRRKRINQKQTLI